MQFNTVVVDYSQALLTESLEKTRLLTTNLFHAIAEASF